jgi:hypothetical protein
MPRWETIRTEGSRPFRPSRSGARRHCWLTPFPRTRAVTAIFKRPRQGAFGSRHQLRFAPADKDYSDDDQDQCDDADCDDHRAGHSFDLAAEDVGGEFKDRRPSKRPESIAKKKLPPRHVIGSSKDASDTAQHRDEAADDDDLAAVFGGFGVASCSCVTRPSALPPFLPSCRICWASDRMTRLPKKAGLNRPHARVCVTNPGL